jgi:hypothetical protein
MYEPFLNTFTLLTFYQKLTPSFLQTGDFAQLEVVTGVPLCKLMFMASLSQELIKAKYLFRLFKVFFLEKQQRASDCKEQQILLEKMRRLPSEFPQENRWRNGDFGDYRPIDNDVVSVLTKELTFEDINSDEDWITKSTILVTSNVDRAIFNSCLAEILSKRQNRLLIKWRKEIVEDINENVQELLYDESKHPELYTQFFYGARGQILDNSNGNVDIGVANGTNCWYESLGWENPEKTAAVMQLIIQASSERRTQITLDEPPDFINVVLADCNGKPLDPKEWEPDINLDKTKSKVVIPIGFMTNNSKNSIMIKGNGGSPLTIHYRQHAVDLAMVLTIWKSQGSTLDRVILHLEGSRNARQWKFEHLYVAISRVRSIEKIRCLPLSALFNRNKLLLLRPNLFTTKWRMSIDDQGRFKEK